MRDDLSTSEWRRPPKRVGPIEEREALVHLLDRNAVPILVTIAFAVLTIAAYVWGVDWLCGHL